MIVRNRGYKLLLNHLIVFSDAGIAPHFFQPVKFPGFFMHYMHHYIDVVYQYPLRAMLALVPERALITFLLYHSFHKIGDGFYLGGAGRLADHEKICNCLWYLVQIQRYNFFPLFLLNGVDDGFKNFRVPR